MHAREEEESRRERKENTTVEDKQAKGGGVNKGVFGCIRRASPCHAHNKVRGEPFPFLPSHPNIQLQHLHVGQPRKPQNSRVSKRHEQSVRGKKKRRG